MPLKNVINPVYYPVILKFSVENYIKELTREAENQIREEKDLPKIGEGWISETNLFYKVKNEFSDYLVVHHGRPKWLGLQHFDIYLPKFNIAIEYQGRQHSEEVDYFGGSEGYERTIANDKLKKEKCRENNCILIEVFPGYNFSSVKKEINSSIRRSSIESN